ncbi:MAG: hypothetical protein P4L77_11535 [Sulfuriferula sp.]|nr:hypothetical protein [Sulfuriferula sp.]
MVQAFVGYPQMEIPRANVAPEGEPTHFSMEAILTDLDSKLGRLFEIHTALESHGKLTLDIAMECDQEFQVNWTRLYFTDVPKRQKYQVAMEELSAGLLTLLAAAAAALIGLIVHLIQWYSGGGEGGAGDIDTSGVELYQSAAEKVAETTISNTTAQEALVEVIKEVKHQNQSATSQAGDYSPKAYKAAEKDHGSKPLVRNAPGYTKALTPLVRDHLSRGEYSRAIVEVLMHLKNAHAVKVVQDTRDAYALALTTGDGEEKKASSGDEAAQQAYVDQFKQKITALLAEPTVVYKDLHAVYTKLTAKAAELGRSAPAVAEDYNASVKVWAEAVASPEILAYVKLREELAPQLEALKKEVEASKQYLADVQKKHASGEATKFDHELAEVGKTVMKSLRDTLGVLGGIDQQFMHYWKSLNAATHYLAFVVSEARRRVVVVLVGKGESKETIESSEAVQQMDKIIAALEPFRQKSS